MTTLLLGILATGISLSAQVQGHLWAKSFGSTNNWDWASAVTNDGTSTYVGGTFTGTMTMNSYTVTSTTNGGAFIARFNNTTGVCTGLTAFGDPDATVKSILFFSSNIYVTGNTGGYFYMGKVSAAFSNGASVTTDILDEGEGRGLTTDGTNIFVAGEMEYGMIFNPTGMPITLTGHSTYRSAFVAKFAASSFTSTVTYSSAVEPYSSSALMDANAIAYYNGYLYITGHFTGNVQLTSGSSTVSPTGYSDLYVAALTNGSPAIAFVSNGIRYGGSNAGTPTPNPGASEFKDNGYGIAVNGYGIFVVGAADGYYTFDSQTSSTSGALNSVVIKYPITSGTGAPGAASWVNLGASTGVNGKCFATAVALSSGSVYVTHCLEDNTGVFYGQSGSVTFSSMGNIAGCVSSYNPSTGAINFAFPIKSTSGNGHHRPRAICAFTCDNFWYVGSIESAATVGNFALTFAGPGYSDCFVAAANGKYTISSNATTCPGVSVSLQVTTGRGLSYSWSNTANLSCSTCSNPSFSSTTPGTYTYTATITDIGGCTGYAVVNVTVLPAVTANAGPDIRYCLTGQTIGTAAQTGATYSWSPTTGLSCSNCAQPVISAAGTYTLTVTDYCGNVTTDVVTVNPYSGSLCHNEGYCQACPNPDDPHRLAGPGAETHPFEVFPNPANGLFNIQFSDGGQHTITVTDLAGREVFRTESNEAAMQIDLRNSGKGVYLLKVREGGAEAIRKLIVE